MQSPAGMRGLAYGQLTCSRVTVVDSVVVLRRGKTKCRGTRQGDKNMEDNRNQEVKKNESALGERSDQFESIPVRDRLASFTSRQLMESMSELIDAGITADEVTERLWVDDIRRVIPELLAHGASVDVIVTSMGRAWVELDGLRTLIENGVAASQLLPSLNPSRRTEHFAELIAAGATEAEIIANLSTDEIVANAQALAAPERGVGSDDLLARCDPRSVAGSLATFVALGARIDFELYLPNLTREDVANHLAVLIEAGAPVDDLVRRLDPWDLSDHVAEVLQAGASVDLVLGRLPRNSIATHASELIGKGADRDGVRSKLTNSDIAFRREELEALGVIGEQETKSDQDLAA
jgi:hypothetical protein